MARDSIAILGLGTLGYGLWMHYPPLAFIVCGGLVVGVVLYGHLRGGK